MIKLQLIIITLFTFLYLTSSAGQNITNFSNQSFNQENLHWHKEKPIVNKAFVNDDPKSEFLSPYLNSSNNSIESFHHKEKGNNFTFDQSSDISRWQKINGPNGGYVTRFYRYFDSLYALAEREIYIYRTDKWEPLNFSIDGTTARCLFVDSTGNILVGTDFSLLMTTNRGKNWTQFTGELRNTGVWQILNFDGNKLLVATNKGIFMGTTDDYILTNINDDLSYVISINLTEDKVLWATTYWGVYKAIYPDLNWTRVNLDTTFYSNVLINKRGTIYY